MKTLRRWWKKLCVGLAASAKERDITHGKINKFGGTGMKAAAVVALPLLMAAAAAPAKAQVGWDGDGARGRARGEPSNFVRSYTDYATSPDGVHTLLDYLNGGDPYGANAVARAIEHAGANPGGASMPGDQIFGSPIIMGPLSNSGSFRYCMPELSY